MPYEQIGNREPVCIADEVPFEIPESWGWCRLGSIITLLSGTDFKPEEYNNQHKGIPYITGASNISGEHVLENRWTENPHVIANEGDLLLVCKGSGYGKTVICDLEEAHIARQIMAIKKSSLVSMEYIQCVLSANFDTLKAKGQGVIPGIDRNSVLHLLCPLPPHTEQERIIAEIDKLLPFIEEYTVKEKQVQSLNDSFPDQLRKSILQYAVQGKLVPQDPDDEPASVLLDRIRAEKEQLIAIGKIKRDKHESVIYRRDNSHYEKIDGDERCIDDEIPFDIPESWAWCRLGNIITLLSGTDFKPEGYNDQHKGIPYITGASNISGEHVLENRWTEHPHVIANEGDLLLVCKGSGYGKTVICDLKEAHIARQIMAIKKSSFVSMKYIQYVLSANFDTLKAQGQGVIPGIDRSSVLRLLCPLPPYEEQLTIVSEIEMLFGLCEQISL